METFSVRIPLQWAGQIRSRDMQAWLARFFQAPAPLPPDPGPGPCQLSLSLPGRAVRFFAEGLGDPAAVALRRLAAVNLGALPRARRELFLPAPAEADTEVQSPSPAARNISSEARLDPFTVDSLPPSELQRLSNVGASGAQPQVEAPSAPEPQMSRRAAWFEVVKVSVLTIVLSILVFWLIWRWLKSFGSKPAETLEAAPAFLPWTPIP